MDGGEVGVDWKVVAVASLALVAERSLRSLRRRTAERSMVVQIIICQSELDHRLRLHLSFLGDVHADFILGSDFGWDPSPLRGVGAEPNVGTHFHILKLLDAAGFKATSSNDDEAIYLVRRLLYSVVAFSVVAVRCSRNDVLEIDMAVMVRMFMMLASRFCLEKTASFGFLFIPVFSHFRL